MELSITGLGPCYLNKTSSIEAASLIFELEWVKGFRQTTSSDLIIFECNFLNFSCFLHVIHDNLTVENDYSRETIRTSRSFFLLLLLLIFISLASLFPPPPLMHFFHLLFLGLSAWEVDVSALLKVKPVMVYTSFRGAQYLTQESQILAAYLWNHTSLCIWRQQKFISFNIIPLDGCFTTDNCCHKHQKWQMRGGLSVELLFKGKLETEVNCDWTD